MKYRLPLIGLLLIFLLPLLSSAQTATLTGILQDKETKAPLQGVDINLNGTTFSGKTNDQGVFEIKNVPYGKYTIVTNSPDYDAASQSEVNVNSPKVDFGIMKVTKTPTPMTNEADDENLPTVALNDAAVKESTASGNNTYAKRDPFETAVVFNFRVARFSPRGYRSETPGFLNGISLEDLATGRTVYPVGGLGSVMYNRDRVYGLNASSYTFGGLDGSTSINLGASNQRKQFQVSYSTSNTSYTNQFAATYGTGLMKGGWAFSSSLARSWTNEGYVSGTFSDGWAWYMSIDKHFGKNHTLSLTQIGANTVRGGSNRATAEVLSLTDNHYYNPNWGYQDGKIRNATVTHRQQPLTVLNHEWTISPTSSLKTAVGYQYGPNAVSHIDYFNAPSPTPDYYRNLPSFQDDPNLAAQVANQWKNDVNVRQINWDKLYNMNVLSNPETVTNVDGIDGNNVTGQRSHYVVYDDVTDTKRINFNTTFTTAINDHHTLTAGYTYQYEQTEYFKRLTDLLGGDFYVDQNQYAEQAFPDSIEAIQNDLNHPNRILHVGDKYGYDYKSTDRKHKVWLQDQFKLGNVDGYVALQMVSTNFYRTGFYRNGIFSDNSYGDSQKKNYLNAGIKGGLNYKLSDKSRVYVNGEYETKAPTFRNSFVSAKTRNDIVDGLRSEEDYSVEGGYMLLTPDVKLRATGFFTQKNHASNVYSFYHDDYRTNVNYNITNIDTRYVGMEFGTEVTLGRGFSANGALSLGDYYFNSRQKATITQDNNSTVLADNETVYSKNFFVPGVQDVGSLGIRYRSRNFWSLNLTGNYFGKHYIGFNPARRTIAGVDQLSEGSTQWESVIDQEKLKDQCTVDFFGSYSWRLNNQFKGLQKRTYLLLSVGVKNLLNNQNIIDSGQEQSRFDFAEKNVNKFATKYSYAYGINYFVKLTLRLN